MSFQRLGRALVAASPLDSFPNLVNEEGHAVVEPLRQVKSISPLENVSSELAVLGDTRENILNEVDGNPVIHKLPKPTSRHSFSSPNKFCVYYYAALAAPAHFFACTSRRFFSFLRWLFDTGSPAASVSGRPLSSKVE